MKLVIQIPCYNEEETLKSVLEGIPRQIPGIKEVEIIVIDDGSTDNTVQVARACGVKRVVRFPANRGLAEAFITGIHTALELGADIIVNTDADNQYPGSEIPKLIGPIQRGEADVVIGNRQVAKLAHFSPLKKMLQAVGSWFVRKLSHTNIPDVVSGFRAYSREAALRLNVISKYSYTTETLIQAGRLKMAVTSVPIEVNLTARPSRLIKSVPSYMRRMAITIIRAYTMYQPLKVFSYLGFLLLAGGAVFFIRYFYFALVFHNTGGHVQSLIFGAVLFIAGFQTLLIGLLSDVVAANRKMIEDVQVKLRSLNIS